MRTLSLVVAIFNFLHNFIKYLLNIFCYKIYSNLVFSVEQRGHTYQKNLSSLDDGSILEILNQSHDVFINAVKSRLTKLQVTFVSLNLFLAALWITCIQCSFFCLYHNLFSIVMILGCRFAFSTDVSLSIFSIFIFYFSSVVTTIISCASCWWSFNSISCRSM